MKTMIETVLPYAKLCGNCVNACRQGEDNGTNKKDMETVACRKFSLLNKQSETEAEGEAIANALSNENVIPAPSLNEAPKGYKVGWGDLMRRPGQAPSNYLSSNCILVSHKDTCPYFQNNKEESEE